MYISELALQGFKSFAYKTDVTFDQGITAIVGPNGCGKSNIVDALRWVLGEQRPTLLRSSSMSNVIFNGTAQKNALGLAEVSLTFINNKGLLPTEYSEVTITRRLYRNGNSEYLINGTKCRLKDIMELFMDTGMSSDAYSVIELKMVEEILNNKNKERRNLFEEAAGITGYKKKRKKTLRKLDKTNENLQRVEDIVSEVEKKTRSLARQSKKAKKAKEYSDELYHLDKAFNRLKHKNIQEELKPLKKRIKNAETEKKQLVEKAGNLEEKEKSLREALNEKEQQQSEAQRRVDQMASELRDKETSLKLTREKVNNEKNIIKQYQKDIKEAESDLKELRELFEHSTKQLESMSKKRERAEKSLNDSKKKYNHVQKEYSALNKTITKLKRSADKKIKKLDELKSKRIKLETRLENTAEDLTRVNDDQKQLNSEIEQLKEKREEASAKLDDAKEQHADNEKALNKAHQKRDELKEKQDKLKDDLRSLQSKYDNILAEIDLLQNIAASNEAFPASVKFLIENHADEFSEFTVLSDVFSTDQEHAVALEAALGDALNYIVVKTLDDAQKAVQFLRDHQKGNATFVPLGELSDSYAMQGESLARHVKAASRYQPLRELLLGQTLFAETWTEAKKKVAQGISVVTKEGEVITDEQFLKSGSGDKNAGMRVGLQDKIETLEKKAKDVAVDIERKETSLADTAQALDNIDVGACQELLKKSGKTVRELENKINGFQSKTEIYRQNEENYEKRTKELKELHQTGGEELKELEPKREELELALKKQNKKRKQEKESLKELEEERTIAQNRFNEARLTHQDLKNKVENVERDVDRAESGIQSLKVRLKKRKSSKKASKKQVENYKQVINTLENKISESKKLKNEADKKLKEAKESSSEQRGSINNVEKDLKEVRRQKEVNMELLHHLSMAKEKFEMKSGNISDHIWETYELLMDQIKVEMPEDITADEAKERISWLRQKLNRIGEVNELAIEEYEEEKERLDFYEEQIGDLENAQEELQETIAEINKTAEKRFNSTFKKIQTNFKKVFHTLFEEDDFCDLTLEGDAEDPLEASIDIEANPRGKRPSSINQLSGGEKTLTAIALLFAIYLVKPSPFCVLDEVDAPLDDANIERFAGMIQRFSEETQFIIITHNKMTMAKAEMMYGVTMPETGVSRLVGVKMDELAEAS